MIQRSQPRFVRLSGAVAALAVFLLSGPGRASTSFPEEIKTKLVMDCAPPCTICHDSLQGGAGTTRGNFAAAMVMAGLIFGQPQTVGPAIDAVRANNSDSDADGTGDIAELEIMRDPMVADPAGAADVLTCGPAYGCGARVAPRPPVDGSALAFALVVAGFLALRSRRRA